MNKTLLVAQREFVENLRTKTFWIGILVAPIGIILFYGVMFLLAEKTDKRTYMVLDRSQGQWFSNEIRQKAASSVFSELFGAMTKGDNDSTADIRRQLEERIAGLADDHPLKELFRRFEVAGIDLEELAKSVHQGGVAAFLVAPKVLEVLTTWANEAQRDPEKIQKLLSIASDLSMKDYEEKPFLEDSDDAEQVLARKLNSGEIFAYFVIPPEPVKDGKGKYVSNNVTDFKLRKWYSDKATDVLREKNIARLTEEKGLQQTDVAAINQHFTFEERQVSETGEEKKVETADKTLKYAPILFVYILWLGVFIAAQMLLTNTVEEKSNRIIEVLLSSVSASQLMHGKIYGIAITGMTVLGSWGLFAFLGIKLAPHLFQDGSAKIAELGLNQIVGNPVYAASFLGYFLTGYLMYASLLVAIGSVCNSLKEAQNLMQPVIFLLIVPLATMFPIAMDPNGTVARIMTYIPLYTPFTMMNRAGGPPDAWEYIASSAVILVTLWLFFRGAGKVFRTGVLMTGKPPRIREILRWMRAPVR